MFELPKRLYAFFNSEPYAVEAKVGLKYRGYKTAVWLVISEISYMICIYPQRWFLDYMTVPGNTTALYLIAVVLGVIGIIGLFLFVRMDWWRNNFTTRLYAMWMSAGQRKELSLSSEWHVMHGTGEKEALIRSNVLKIERVISEFLFGMVPVVTRILITSLLMLFVGWRFTLLALCTFGAYAFVTYMVSGPMNEMSKEYMADKKNLEQAGSNLSSNWLPIRSFGEEDRHAELYKAECIRFAEDENPRHSKWRYHTVQQDMVIMISRTCLFLLAGYTYAYHPEELSVGTFALGLAWMERNYSNYFRISESIIHLFQGYQSLITLLEVFETRSAVPEPEEIQWPKTQSGHIEFHGVSYAYGDTTREALKNINLTIKPHTVVAIIGYSGSGKSTLMNLLQLAAHPTVGEILIDGVSLRNMSSKRYRKEYIGVVNQSPQLFDDTIANNIRMGNYEATDAEVEAAAHAAYAHEFIMDMPNGYNTRIGENGVRLSGGEKQRITIARALLRQPRILILDEATSSLDPESQYGVQQSIDNQIEKRSSTIFVIAHRFSTIMKADLVISLEKGEISEVGTHEELSRGNGVYAKFKAMEQKGFLT